MRALVLSGGGAKGAYQVGVLKRWMLEQKRDYRIVSGVSVGALNGAALCQAPLGSPELAYRYLEGIWSRVENKKIKKWWFGWWLAALWKSSVYNSKPLEDWVHTELDPDSIRNSGRELQVGVVSQNTGRYVVATQRAAELCKWVLASASFPVFFKPIDIEGESWTDGGVRDVTPVIEAIRVGATEIDVIMCSNPELPKPWDPKGKNAIDVALRTIDLMTDEIIRGDIRVTGMWNELAELTPKYRNVKINIQQPSVYLTDDSLDFDPKKVRRMMDRGYADALESE